MQGEPDAAEQVCAANRHRYSIYTDAHFWGERGISLVTTESVIRGAVSDALDRHYGRDVYAAGAVVARGAFAERRMGGGGGGGGKGVGLVARRALARGELIIREPPTLVVHLDARRDVADEARLRMQRAAVGLLPPGARAETLGLMGRWGGDEIEDRLRTNSFVISLEEPMDHHALFTQMSVWGPVTSDIPPSSLPPTGLLTFAAAETESCLPTKVRSDQVPLPGCFVEPLTPFALAASTSSTVGP